jgi:hypothetical protein
VSGGQKRIIYNTRERLVSDDANRAQDFAAADRAELFRAMHGDVLGDFYERPGVNYRWWANPADSPLPAEVYGGLEVIVDDPTDLEVLPGVLMHYAYNPTPGDDSEYLLGVDLEGFSTPGVLSFQANAGPGVRIDVIECQPVDTLLESDSRDVYDNATGQFSASILDKVRTSRLQYQIRRGSPGAGPPGYSPSWLPLAVAIVQQGAADWSEVDFYDVRPLVAERAPLPSRSLPGFEFANVEHASALEEVSLVPATSSIYQKGYFRGWFQGYMIGGNVRRNTASSLGVFGDTTGDDGGDVPYLFTGGAGENAPAGTFPTTGRNLFTIAAFFPSLSPTNLGKVLPRWVRYSQNAQADWPARRRPVGPRGILVVTTALPQPNGLVYPSNMPAQMGWTHASWARAIAAVPTDAAGGPTFVAATDRWVYCYNPTSHAHTSVVGSYIEWVYAAPWTHVFAANCEEALVKFEAELTGTPGAEVVLNVEVLSARDTGSPIYTQAVWSETRDVIVPAGGTATVGFTAEVPLPSTDRREDVNSPDSVCIRLFFTFPAAAVTPSAGTMTVLAMRQR